MSAFSKTKVSYLLFFKLFVILGFPFLGVIYFFQFYEVDRDTVIPFSVFSAPKTVAESVSGQSTPLLFTKPVTIVNFWATWCAPCVEELPALIELQRRLEAKGVEIYFISIDSEWSVVSNFLLNNRLKISPTRLFIDRDKKLAHLWGSYKFPETYVVANSGWVLEKIVGLQQWTLPNSIGYFEKLAAKLDKFAY